LIIIFKIFEDSGSLNSGFLDHYIAHFFPFCQLSFEPNKNPSFKHCSLSKKKTPRMVFQRVLHCFQKTPICSATVARCVLGSEFAQVAKLERRFVVNVEEFPDIWEELLPVVPLAQAGNILVGRGVWRRVQMLINRWNLNGIPTLLTFL
jgi:hypothetical protein